MIIALLYLLAGAQDLPPDPIFDHPSVARDFDTGRFDPALREHGISVAGIAAIHRAAADKPSPAHEAETMRAAERALDKVVKATPFDLDALTRALRARDALVADRARARSTRLLKYLTVLSPADRAILIRLVETGEPDRDTAGHAVSGVAHSTPIDPRAPLGHPLGTPR